MRLTRVRGGPCADAALGFGELYCLYKLLALLTHMLHIYMGAVRTASTFWTHPMLYRKD